jgi:hypothetical protein
VTFDHLVILRFDHLKLFCGAAFGALFRLSRSRRCTFRQLAADGICGDGARKYVDQRQNIERKSQGFFQLLTLSTHDQPTEA